MSAREVIVWGKPATQGSKKFVGMSKAGHAILVEDSTRTRPWRESVRWAILGAYPFAKDRLLPGAVAVQLHFTLPKPKSAPKRRITYPATKPDVSKLIRCVEDSMVDLGLIEDDARIVLETARKYYPNEGRMSLGSPGCRILVDPIMPPLWDDTAEQE